MTICCAAVLTLGLAACGGGGSDDTADAPTTTDPMPTPVVYPTALPDGHGLNPGMTVIPAGTTSMLPSGTYITCAGAEDCTLTISIESVTGALSASSMGGMVSVSTEATRQAAVEAANQQTLADARAALAALDAMDPGDVTANQRAAAEMALANALALPGNEDAPENQPDPTPPPAPVASVMVPDAMYLDADNAPAAGTHMIPAGESATNNGVVFSCPADGDACEVEVAADGSVTSTGGEATAALSNAATLQVTQAKKAKEDMLAEEKMERRDRVIGKDRALEAASGFAADDTAGSLDENDISITRGAGATARVRVMDIAGYTASDMPILQNPGWAERRLMRTIPGNTQHLFVYTDIGPPTRIQFYNWDGDANTPARYGTNDATPATVTDLDLNDGTTNLMTRGNLDSNFNSPGPAAGGNVRQTFPVASATATTVTRQGNFNGAPGTYTCTTTAGVDCVVTISPTGTYTETTGTWEFTPELGATAWWNDTEFMSFGWWLQEPRNQDGAYTFQYYADGNVHTPAPGTLTTGTATYTGRAAGKFVVQEIEDAGVVDGEAGMFVAAATLNASFGETVNSISGSITGFQSDNAAVDVSSWSVTLHRKTLGAKASLATAFGATQAETDPSRATYDGTTATMGDQTAYGNWQGQFFGDANTGNTRDAYPLGVGGTFQADNDAASIAGAFGARR